MKITDTILIDDDPLFRFSIKKMVKDHINQTAFTSFACGYDALDYIQSINLQNSTRVLILLDLHIPLLNGWGFLKKLEEKIIGMEHKFSVHIMSSTKDINKKKELLDHKLVESFISKPVTMKELSKLLG